MRFSNDGYLDGSVRSYNNLDWHDSKKYAWILSIVPAIIPMIIYGIVIWLNYINAPSFFIHLSWALGPILVFGLIPICDWVLGIDGKNVSDELVPYLEEDKYYRVVTYLYFPLMLISLVLCCYLWINFDMSIVDKIFLAWSMGMTSGIGIVSAHELGHKKGEFERWLGKLSLAIPFYGHFYIEHNKGHHVKVATPEDPVSSQMGENVYFYLLRSIPKQIPRSWNLEKSRLGRIGKSEFSLSNDVFNAWLLSILLWGILILSFGIKILPFLVIQAVVGILLLEFVNYIEHYGLLRQKEEDGRYERCKPSHSWNSDSLLTNIFLYQLQRHSDHHANPTRRFQSLRSDCSVPNLPFGYATSLIYASIPFLWFKIMDTMLMKHYNFDLYKANIYPRAKKKLELKWLKNKDFNKKEESFLIISYIFKVILFLIISIILSAVGILGIFSEGFIANISPFTLIFGLILFLTCLSALIRGEPVVSDYVIPERNNIKKVVKKEVVKDIYQCPGCGYVIDMSKGDIEQGISVGTKWEDIPDDWICPDCGVRDKVDFIKIK